MVQLTKHVYTSWLEQRPTAKAARVERVKDRSVHICTYGLHDVMIFDREPGEFKETVIDLKSN